LRFPLWMQALGVLLIAAVLVLSITQVVDNWSDWVVLGVIVVTTIAVSFAVYNRQYPTKRRSFTKDSKSNW
jgi:NADH:ubiquinone oxidoreductase subunit 4 (subunit M)